MSRERRPNTAGQATRHRILEATWELIVERGISVSINEIAGAAAVTRQTVYFHFGSRAGLLVAMAQHRDTQERIGGEFAKARSEPTARAVLEATIRTWCRYIPRILPVARALYNAAEVDEDAARAWWDRMDAIRGTFRHAVQGLADAGELDPSWTVAEATDVLWAIMHPRAWADLVEHHRWDPDRLVDRQIEVVERRSEERRVGKEC